MQTGTLTLKSNDGPLDQFVWTLPHEATNPNHQPKLVFARYGKEVFLNMVHISSDNKSRELLQGDREKMLIRKRASGEEFSLLMEDGVGWLM